MFWLYPNLWLANEGPCVPSLFFCLGILLFLAEFGFSLFWGISCLFFLTFDILNLNVSGLGKGVGWLLPYYNGYIGMCHGTGYGFWGSWSLNSLVALWCNKKLIQKPFRRLSQKIVKLLEINKQDTSPSFSPTVCFPKLEIFVNIFCTNLKSLIWSCHAGVPLWYTTWWPVNSVNIWNLLWLLDLDFRRWSHHVHTKNKIYAWCLTFNVTETKQSWPIHAIHFICFPLEQGVIGSGFKTLYGTHLSKMYGSTPHLTPPPVYWPNYTL